jgi:hypothetical protein
MVLDLKRSVIQLEYREIVSMEDAAGARIDCVRGRVWITEYRSTGDVILEPGESYELSQNGAAVVQSLREACVAIRFPAPISATTELAAQVRHLWAPLAPKEAATRA